MVSIIDLGNSINARSAEVLARMVAFGEVAAGQNVTLQSDSGNDVTIGSYDNLRVVRDANGEFDIYTSAQATNDPTKAIAHIDKATDGKLTVDAGIGNDLGRSVASQLINGKMLDDLASSGAKHDLDVIAGSLVAVDGSVQAGGMVELQYKIDSMLSSIQMSIKNGGQVAQTLQAAARG